MERPESPTDTAGWREYLSEETSLQEAMRRVREAVACGVDLFALVAAEVDARAGQEFGGRR